MAGYADEDTEAAVPDLPDFDRDTTRDWGQADQLVHRWANLNESELLEAAGRLPLDSLRALFLFVESASRTHRERAEESAVLSENLRRIVATAANYGNDDNKRESF